MNLLIVDDEAQIIQGIMEGVDWGQLPFEKVLTVKSYEQALEIFRTETVEVLLSDIEMAAHSGLELIAWVNEHFPETECIILSCHEEFHYARKAVELKCLNYVLKPVPYEILTAELLRAAEAVRHKHSQSMLEDYGKVYVKQMGGQLQEGDQADVVQRAADYVREHIGEDIPVETLAKEMHVSPRHLGRLFKKELNQTVSDYITSQKMLLAGELLQETRLSVTMVADRVGYGNYSYFIKLFKKSYGMTPREYQVQHKKAQASRQNGEPLVGNTGNTK